MPCAIQIEFRVPRVWIMLLISPFFILLIKQEDAAIILKLSVILVRLELKNFSLRMSISARKKTPQIPRAGSFSFIVNYFSIIRNKTAMLVWSRTSGESEFLPFLIRSFELKEHSVGVCLSVKSAIGKFGFTGFGRMQHDLQSWF